jgi:hypothetical protein
MVVVFAAAPAPVHPESGSVLGHGLLSFVEVLEKVFE